MAEDWQVAQGHLEYEARVCLGSKSDIQGHFLPPPTLVVRTSTHLARTNIQAENLMWHHVMDFGKQEISGTAIWLSRCQTSRRKAQQCLVQLTPKWMSSPWRL